MINEESEEYKKPCIKKIKSDILKHNIVKMNH